MATFILAGFHALAGRPVYTELSIEELTHQAAYIVVGSLEQKLIPQKNGCDPHYAKVKIVSILKASVGPYPPAAGSAPPNPAAVKNAVVPGQVMEVLLNQTGLQDCAYRKENASGYSFSATRFSSDLHFGLLEPKKSYIIFLAKPGSTWTLAVDNSILSLAMKSKVLEVLKPKPKQ